MATTFPSARGEKATEAQFRPEGRNTIAKVELFGGNASTTWGPDYAAANLANVEAGLLATIDMGRVPLLWTYAEHDAQFIEVVFGFDDPIGNNKIGHVALTAEATISGEISRHNAQWKINNESGAWGNMGGTAGKSQKMTLVAQFMNAHCGGMQVIAAHAYSSTGWKRKIQQIFR
jgi:hypothetical protein